MIPLRGAKTGEFLGGQGQSTPPLIEESLVDPSFSLSASLPAGEREVGMKEPGTTWVLFLTEFEDE